MTRRLCLSLWVVAAAIGCKSEQPESAPPPLPVQVTRVVRRDLALTVEVTGTLEALPGMDVKLAPLTAGRLDKLTVAEGDAVEKGQLLAELDRGPLEDAEKKAAASATDAEAAAANDAQKLKREEELFKAGVSAKQEADDARAQAAASEGRRQAALAELSNARRQLSRARIEAPFQGVVAHVFTAAGEIVDPSKPVIEVANTQQLELRANLSSSMLSKLQKGQPAELFLDEQPIRGEVYALSPSVDPQTGAGVARLRFTNPGKLHLGQLARAVITLEARHQVAAVPLSALTRADTTAAAEAGSGRAVTVVNADGRTQTVRVKTGAEQGGWVELVEGPAEGTLLVAGGGYSIPDGTVVRFDGGTGAAP